MAYSQKDKEKIFNQICAKIISGAALRKCLKELKFSSDTFYKWLDKDPEFAKRYARAAAIRGEAKADEIEDDYNAEPERDPETGKIDTGWVQLQRLKIDSKKWYAAKLSPKLYGDKTRHEVTGEDGGDIVVKIEMPEDI